MTQAARTLPQALVQERQASGVRHGLRGVLGPAAWSRLPEAVRERFADCAGAAIYVGCLEVVRASWLGLAFAWVGRVFGTPVTPRTGTMSPAACWYVPGRAGSPGIANTTGQTAARTWCARPRW